MKYDRLLQEISEASIDEGEWDSYATEDLDSTMRDASQLFYACDHAETTSPEASVEDSSPQNNTMVMNFGGEESIERHIRIYRKDNVYYVYLNALILTRSGSEDHASRFIVWLRSFPKNTSARIYFYIFRPQSIMVQNISLSDSARPLYMPPAQTALNAILMTNAYTTFVIDRMFDHIESHMAMCADEIIFKPAGVWVIKPIHIADNHDYFQRLFDFYKYLYRRAVDRGYLTDADYETLNSRKRVVKYGSYVQATMPQDPPPTPSEPSPQEES